MLKTVRNVIIFLAVATAIAVIALLAYNSGRTYYNEEEEEGNTTGNIYNGGLFCEQDGRIYFSNSAADGKLYVMNLDCSNIRKLHDDKAVFINADANYIYYVRANYTREDSKGSLMMFYNTGVFRLNYNGQNLLSYTSDPGQYLMLRGNYIYFQRYQANVGLFLYRNKIDRKEERLLVKDAVVPATVRDGALLYTGYSKNHSINAMDLKSFTTHPIVEGNIAYPIIMDQGIYYINQEDNYHIYRRNADGTDAVPVITERCSTYNISMDGNYLFYQVDDAKNNRICRYNLKTKESETLLTGNYKQIHVTSNYVFFRDFDNINTYIQDVDGIVNINTFNPPDLDAPAPAK